MSVKEQVKEISEANAHFQKYFSMEDISYLCAKFFYASYMILCELEKFCKAEDHANKLILRAKNELNIVWESMEKDLPFFFGCEGYKPDSD